MEAIICLLQELLQTLELARLQVGLISVLISYERTPTRGRQTLAEAELTLETSLLSWLLGGKSEVCVGPQLLCSSYQEQWVQETAGQQRGQAAPILLARALAPNRTVCLSV